VYLHTERGDVFVCDCPVSGSGCSCTFNAPSNAGTYTYRSTLDIDGDGIYDKYGDATLTVTTPTSTSTTTTTTIPTCTYRKCEQANSVDCKCGTETCYKNLEPYCCEADNECYETQSSCKTGSCAPTTTSTTSTTTTTLPNCPYTCTYSTYCYQMDGTCQSGYSCSGNYDCCCILTPIPAGILSTLWNFIKFILGIK
jgi:hypothetical protein